MDKHNSCINSLAIIRYLENKAPERIGELFKNLGEELDAVEDKREFLSNPSNWISSELLILLFKRAAFILDDPDTAFKIGFDSVLHHHFGYIQKIIIYAFGSPDRVIARLQKVNDHFNKTKKVEILDVGPCHATVRFHWQEGIVLSRDFCDYNRGIYQAVPLIWNLPEAVLEERACYFKGDPFCEYHISWERPNRLRTLIFNIFSPWRLVRATIRELERDKEALKEKYHKIHELNQKLEKKVEQLTILQESSSAILSTIDLKELLELILWRLAKVANLDRAGIFLLDDKKRRFELIHAVGVEDEVLDRLKGYNISIDKMDNIIARSAAGTDPVIVDDAALLSLNHENPLLKKFKPSAFVLVPLKARGHTVGIMLGDNSTLPDFADEIDKEFLKNFANHIAVALDNATLYARLQESEQKYRDIVENVNEGIWIIGENAEIKYANSHIETMLGKDRLEGSSVYSLVDEENRQILFKIILENMLGNMSRQEVRLIAGDNTSKSVLLSSVPMYSDHEYTGSLAIITDLTQQKNMEERLLQVKKLEAISTMAGGIAHDFNNILTGIMGYASMLKREVNYTPNLCRYVEIIESSAARASELVRKMLLFSMDITCQECSNIDVSRVIYETVEEIRDSLPEDIVLDLRIEDDLPPVAGHPENIRKILRNLCDNAIDAMPAGGILTVRLSRADAVTVKNDHPGTDTGKNTNYVKMLVSDTGTGMDSGVKERIFDPFFTTKEIGKGSGLGLPLIYGIVKGMDGHVFVESVLGQGTSFELMIPSVMSEPEPLLEIAGDQVRFVGNETVMVIGADPDFRENAILILEKMGYTVIRAVAGDEAVAEVINSRKLVDLIILDMEIPDMGWREVYRSIKKLVPEVKVLLCRGEDIAEPEMVDEPGSCSIGYVAKPIKLWEFLSRVRELLDSA